MERKDTLSLQIHVTVGDGYVYGRVRTIEAERFDKEPEAIVEYLHGSIVEQVKEAYLEHCNKAAAEEEKEKDGPDADELPM